MPLLSRSSAGLELRACDGVARTLRGGATVVAFCTSWPASVGEALRAELRGLGATLAVLVPGSGVLLRPDDEAEQLDAAPELWERFGASAQRPLFVLLDGEGRVRLRKPLEAGADAYATLLRALREAGRAVRAAPRGVSRRELLVSTLVVAIAAAVLERCASAPARPQGDPQQQLGVAGPGMIDVALVVNGEKRSLRIEPRVTLLDALREQLGLTGTKKGCDMGQCGACTVLVDGKRVDSCLALAAQVDGRSITTIEGLARGDELHPMQQSFLDHDAFQCGYCTPGQILSAVALLGEGGPLSDDDIRERMSGNVCRCGAYANIVAAVRAVAGRS
jgi:xanthine dehydrogenase YagT iron-sulfur-binding subunit